MKFTIIAVVAICVLSCQRTHGGTIPQTLGQAASGVASNIAANSGTILKNAEIAAGTVGEVGGSILGIDVNNLAASSASDTANLGLVGVLGQAASGVAQNIAANSGTILKNSIISAGTVAEIGAGVLGNDIKNAAQEVGATNVNAVSGLVGTLTNVASNIADGTSDQAAAGVASAAGTIVKNAEIGAGTVVNVGAGILSGVAQNVAANSGTILKNSIISAGTAAEIGAGVLGNDVKNTAGLVGTLTNVASNIADGTSDQAAAGVASASGALTQAAGTIVKNAEIGAGTVIKVGAGILGI